MTSLDSSDPLVVAVLCAAWCRTCGDFQRVVDRLAATRPHVRFVWIDIEDDSELCGDLDIEDFPTLAVLRGATPIHFGTSLPLEAVVGRLVDELATRGADTLVEWPETIRALAAAVHARASKGGDA